VRRVLRLYVVSAFLVGLAVFAVTGAKVYAAWGDEPEANAARTTPTTPEEACANPETYWTPLCQGSENPPEPPPPPEPNPPKPTVQEGHESCLWYRGRIKWCLIEPGGEEWYFTPKPKRRYVLSDLTHDEALGYLRATSYGWRAMNKVCFKGPQPCAWARDGRVVLLSKDARVLHVYSGKGLKLGTARGPHAIAVAAHKLIYGDCRYVWTEEPLTWKPCRRGLGQ
jgi:hypothetical protein